MWSLPHLHELVCGLVQSKCVFVTVVLIDVRIILYSHKQPLQILNSTAGERSAFNEMETLPCSHFAP